MSANRLQTLEQAAGSPFSKVAECLYRHESSGVYYALVKRGRKQFRRSLKTNDRQLASRRLAEFREKVGRLSQAKGSNQITFGEVADRWLEVVRGNLKSSSAKRRKTSIAQLKKFFGGLAVRNITAAVCDEWAVKRGEKIAASTFNNGRDTLRAVLEYARRDGLLLDNPAVNLVRRKMGKSRIVIPSREQFQLLVDTIRQADSRARVGADLVELLAYSGMRLAEATSILWGEIDFARNCFIVTGGELGTKNHEARTVPLFPAFRNLLERLRGEGVPASSERVIKIDSAKTAVSNACRKAKLSNFTHHTMRHYFVSNAIEAGIDFKTIAGWVGHKDGGVLVARTYGHLRDSHSFDMAKRMTFQANGNE